MSDIEKTEEQCQIENEQIERMFPNAKFIIAIDIDELDDIVTDKKFITVAKTYTCYCYDNCNKTPKYFYVTGDKITNRVILNKLIEYNLYIECNHCFIEGFDKISDYQFEISTGS